MTNYLPGPRQSCDGVPYRGGLCRVMEWVLSGGRLVVATVGADRIAEICTLILSMAPV